LINFDYNTDNPCDDTSVYGSYWIISTWNLSKELSSE
jgi:hypothetical protein